MLANALRGLAAELGLTAPKGRHKLAELIALANADESIPAVGRQAMAELHAHGGMVAERLATLEAEITGHARHDATARRLGISRSCLYLKLRKFGVHPRPASSAGDPRNGQSA